MPDEPSLKAAFEEICRDVKQFQGAVGQITQKIKDAERRDHVDALLEAFQKAFSDVETAVPRAIASLEEQHKAQLERLQKCQAQAAALRQRLEEAKVKPPAKAPAEALAPDPEHAALLRREVLERFAERAQPAAADAGHVMDIPSSAWGKQSAAKPGAAAAPARQRDPEPKKPARPRDPEDAADISSAAWDKDEPE